MSSYNRALNTPTDSGKKPNSDNQALFNQIDPRRANIYNFPAYTSPGYIPLVSPTMWLNPNLAPFPVMLSGSEDCGVNLLDGTPTLRNGPRDLPTFPLYSHEQIHCMNYWYYCYNQQFGVPQNYWSNQNTGDYAVDGNNKKEIRFSIDEILSTQTPNPTKACHIPETLIYTTQNEGISAETTSTIGTMETKSTPGCQNESNGTVPSSVSSDETSIFSQCPGYTDANSDLDTKVDNDDWVWVGPGCSTKGLRGRAKRIIYRKVRNHSKTYKVGSYVKLHKSSRKSLSYLYCQIKCLYETVLNSKRMNIQLLTVSSDPAKGNILIRNKRMAKKCFFVSDIVDTIDVMGYAEFEHIQRSGDIVKKLRTFCVEGE